METTEEQPAAEPCCLCTSCGVQTCKNDIGSEHVRNGATKEYDRVCPSCFVTKWPCSIKLHFDHGLPPFVEERMRSLAVLRRLNNWFHGAPVAHVYYVNRADTETLDWQYRWCEFDRSNPPRKPWSYRGWCGGSRIVVIVDSKGVETADSVEWLTYHELGHLECQRSAKMSDSAWYAENKNEGRITYEWESDAGHEADSEERHVNRLATAFMGGKEYARPWWRPRVNALLAGQPIPEDPHHA